LIQSCFIFAGVSEALRNNFIYREGDTIMSDNIRILSIDGGGVRGIIPAMVLQALMVTAKRRTFSI
jgi:hypothetical protein